jgi:hypothetical protein
VMTRGPSSAGESRERSKGGGTPDTRPTPGPPGHDLVTHHSLSLSLSLTLSQLAMAHLICREPPPSGDQHSSHILLHSPLLTPHTLSTVMLKGCGKLLLVLYSCPDSPPPTTHLTLPLPLPLMVRRLKP